MSQDVQVLINERIFTYDYLIIVDPYFLTKSWIFWG